MAKALRSLGWDYLMFVIFICITIFTPLWKRLFGKSKQRSKADYVFATGSVSLVAIMLSIARGTLGVRTVLGYPSELFYRGSAMWEVIYGMASAYPIVCFIFVPVYFNLGITSVYQYIDLRFKSRLVRCLASGTYIVRQICSLGIAVYTPSVALATLIGIPYWASIVGMGTICIFFTTMGGLKAAINADVIQTMTVIVVTMVVIIRGTIASGGVARVFELNKDNDRLKFFNFTGDMTVRVDTTSAWLGQLFMSLSQFGCQQNFMQRYVSLKSLKEVKRAMMSNIPIIFIFFSLSWLSGMVIYSTYANCDPYADGYIQKRDEILPFFVEDKLSIIPGFAGIFVAMLFNGALCMMVSNLNSLATVCWEDFISHLPQFRGLADKQQLRALRFVTVICGLITMGTAFGVGLLSGVIESSMLAFSATSGPLLGCFILAMLVPFANWKGTSAGMITSCAFVLWIISGAFTITKTEEFLQTSIVGCTNDTFTQAIYRPPQGSSSWLMANAQNINQTTYNQTDFEFTTDSVEERTPMETFYSISYMYYSLIGTLLTVVIGCVGSYFTQDEKDSYDSKLLHPLVFNFCQRFDGPKPYHIKEDVSDLTTVTNGKGAQINHAFEPIANETNLKIGTTNGAVTIATICTSNGNSNGKQKDKSPIDAVVFTTQAPTVITTAAAATNTTTTSNDNGKHNEQFNHRIAGSLPHKDSVADCESGTYRRFTEKDTI